jgi:hypothetical protein
VFAEEDKCINLSKKVCVAVSRPGGELSLDGTGPGWGLLVDNTDEPTFGTVSENAILPVNRKLLSLNKKLGEIMSRLFGLWSGHEWQSWKLFDRYANIEGTWIKICRKSLPHKIPSFHIIHIHELARTKMPGSSVCELDGHHQIA